MLSICCWCCCNDNDEIYSFYIKHRPTNCFEILFHPLKRLRSGILICFHLFDYYIAFMCSSSSMYVCMRLFTNSKRVLASLRPNMYIQFDVVVVIIIFVQLWHLLSCLYQSGWTKFFVLFCFGIFFFLFTFFVFWFFFLFETIWFYAEKNGRKSEKNSTNFPKCPHFPVVSWNIYVLYLCVNLSPLLDIIINQRNHDDVKFCCMHFLKTWTWTWTSFFYMPLCDLWMLYMFTISLCSENKINISLFRFVSHLA